MDTIVDRHIATGLVAKKIMAIRHSKEPNRERILAFHGVAGIGKTALQKFFVDYYSEKHSCVPEVCQDVKPCGQEHDPIPCLYINLHTNSYKGENAGYVNLLRDLANQILIFSQGVINRDIRKAFESSIEQFEKKLAGGNTEEHQAALQDITINFVDIFQALLDTQDVVLLILDSLEKVNSAVFTQFELEILDHFFDERKLLVIISGTKPVEWNRQSHLKNFCYWRQLSLFPSHVTGEQLRRMDTEITDEHLADICAQVQRMTKGHPFANTKLIEFWQKEKNEEKSEIKLIDWLTEQSTEIARNLVEDVIYEYILGPRNETLRDIFLKISVARQFEVNLFADLLKNSCEPVTMSVNALTAIELMGNVEGTELIRWDKSKKGWITETVVRHILANHIRLNYPESYLALHETALEKFMQWIDGVPKDSHLFIAQSLYHHACLFINKNPKATPGAIFNELRAKLVGYLEKPGISKTALKRVLASDEELKEILGEKLLKELIDIINEEV